MTFEHPDHVHYRPFTERQEIDKAIHTLTGILKGAGIDNELNTDECKEILNWSKEYREFIRLAPFNELIPVLDSVLADGKINPEEHAELLWVCKNLSPESEFYDAITNDIQQLHGILHGIMADDRISTEETRQLENWVDEHVHLKGIYPYDELESLLLGILRDGKVEKGEEQDMRAFFESFIQYSFGRRKRHTEERGGSGIPKHFTLPGICATCPDISFNGKTFTFTGASMRGKRGELVDKVTIRGGLVSGNITKKTDFLIIGAGGNPCWAFACYGRKVEKAVDYRKQGCQIIIAHETDFWDAVEDNPC